MVIVLMADALCINQVSLQSWSKLMAPLVNMIKTGCKKINLHCLSFWSFI